MYDEENRKERENMLFDTHAHYDASAFDGDRDQVLAGLSDKGVELVLNPGCDLTSSRMAVELAERHPGVYAAVGFHPEDLDGAERSVLEEIRALAAHPKVKAIGEIGLDYYWVKDEEGRRKERDFFAAQLDLARTLDLPVIIHDRDAHKDCLEMVLGLPWANGVFHCCALSAEDAKKVTDRGWMVSFTGNITYKNARRALEVIAGTPMEQIMVETDSPYMVPEPFRGRGVRNDSGYVYRVAETIAQVKGLPVEEVVRRTNENGRRLFRITGKEAHTK